MRSRYANGRSSASATAFRLTGASLPWSPSWISSRTPYSALVVKIIAANPTNAVGDIRAPPVDRVQAWAVMEGPPLALDAVLQALPDAALVVDPARAIVAANDQAAR